jgi:transcriptional regulator
MYTPPAFKIEDKVEMISFMKKYNFANLVSQVKGRLWATHIPFMVVEQGDVVHLIAHISKGNRQWKDIENQEIMVIFNGPHAFVSADWYDHENVSTWNYQAVHAYGNAKILEGEAIFEAIKLLNEKYEHPSSSAHIDNMSPDFVHRELNGLVALQINVTELTGTYKLSQNRDNHNFNEVIIRLKNSDNADNQQVAAAMKTIDRNQH